MPIKLDWLISRANVGFCNALCAAACAASGDFAKCSPASLEGSLVGQPLTY